MSLDVALEYAARGWHVFPVRPLAGDPSRPKGTPERELYDASKKGVSCEDCGLNGGFFPSTDDPYAIAAWWRHHPNARIGVAVEFSELLVVDLDDYKTPDPKRSGRTPLPMDALPGTLTAASASGGTHAYYQAPHSDPSTKAFRDGEVKATGYVVAPSPGSGYTWVNEGAEVATLPDEVVGMLLNPPHEHSGESPTETIVAQRQVELEQWLSDAALGPYKIKHRPGRVVAVLETCPWDDDHDWSAFVMRASGGGWSAGCHHNGCDSGIQRWGDIRDRAPMPAQRDENGRVKVRGEARGPWDERDDVEPDDVSVPAIPPSGFPIDALPGPLARMVEEGSRTICCPPDYIGAAGLAILGAAIGGNVELLVTETWRERAALWVAIVGEPGARKTPAMKPLMAPVRAEQKELFARAKLARAQEADDARNDKRKPKRIPSEQVWVDDTTIEALHMVLGDNPQGVLMCSDELSGWVRGMGAYKGGLGRDRQHWLSIWAGASFPVNRKGDEGIPIYIQRPFVGLVGGIQPDVVGDIHGGRDDGLLERLLFAQGTPVPVRLVRDGISPKTQKEYESLWQQLRGYGVLGGAVTLSSEAWDVFLAWHDRVMGEMERMTSDLRGVWAKMPAQCARIALVLHCCTLRRHPLDAETMSRAVRLADYFMGQVRQVTRGHAGDTPYERTHAERMDRLEAWLADHPEATRRDIYKSGPGRWSRKSESLEPVLRDLVAAGRASIGAS